MPKARVWDGPIPGTHENGFIEPQLREIAVPKLLEPLRRAAKELHVFTFGECSVVLGHEEALGDGLRWHLTISHPLRHPSWDEIKTVRYRLLGPDTVVAMILPEAHMYVNIREQDHVFQLYQLIDDETRPWR